MWGVNDITEPVFVAEVTTDPSFCQPTDARKTGPLVGISASNLHGHVASRN